jgi:hypothetical protein
MQGGSRRSFGQSSGMSSVTEPLGTVTRRDQPKEPIEPRGFSSVGRELSGGASPNRSPHPSSEDDSRPGIGRLRRSFRLRRRARSCRGFVRRDRRRVRDRPALMAPLPGAARGGRPDRGRCAQEGTREAAGLPIARHDRGRTLSEFRAPRLREWRPSALRGGAVH